MSPKANGSPQEGPNIQFAIANFGSTYLFSFPMFGMLGFQKSFKQVVELDGASFDIKLLMESGQTVDLSGRDSEEFWKWFLVCTGGVATSPV